MLHTKFRGNRSTGSGEDSSLHGFIILWAWWPSGHVTQMPRTNFGAPSHRGFIQNLALIGQAVSENKMFEIVHDVGRTDVRRTPEHGYTVSSPMSSGELKQKQMLQFAEFSPRNKVPRF